MNEAYIKIKRSTKVGLCKYLLPSTIGQDVSLAQDHALVKCREYVFDSLCYEDNGELRVGGSEFIYGVQQEFSPGDI